MCVCVYVYTIICIYVYSRIQLQNMFADLDLLTKQFPLELVDKMLRSRIIIYGMIMIITITLINKPPQRHLPLPRLLSTDRTQATPRLLDQIPEIPFHGHTRPRLANGPSILSTTVQCLRQRQPAVWVKY